MDSAAANRNTPGIIMMKRKSMGTPSWDKTTGMAAIAIQAGFRTGAQERCAVFPF